MSIHQGEELEAFLYGKRINRSQLIEELKISRATLYNWLNKRELPLDTLALLKESIGFVPGEKSTVPDKTTVQYDVRQVEKPPGQLERHNIIRVPLHAVGGFLAGYKNKVFLDMLERYSLPGFLGEYWDFEVEGMSMFKVDDDRSAKPGDRLLCKKMDGFHDLRKNKGYVLQTIDGLCYKVFEKIKDERAYFHTLNPDFKHMDFHMKEIKAIYYVDFIIRKQNT